MPSMEILHREVVHVNPLIFQECDTIYIVWGMLWPSANNVELCMDAERVEEIKSELRDIDSVLLVMRMEREQLRKELRSYQAQENGNAIVNIEAAVVTENEVKRRSL